MRGSWLLSKVTQAVMSRAARLPMLTLHVDYAGVTAKQFDLLVRAMQQVGRTASASDTPGKQGKLAPCTYLQIAWSHCTAS